MKQEHTDRAIIVDEVSTDSSSEQSKLEIPSQIDNYTQGAGAPMLTVFHVAIQYMKFSAVGCTATLTHVALFMLFIEEGRVAPVLANVVAFCGAVLVSFCLQFYWTFRDEGKAEACDVRRRRNALAKFVVVALIGLALNSLSVYLIVNAFALPYVYAMVPMVTAVPICTFLLSKLWAFT